ncbi:MULTISPECIES: sulfurtransferase TusA family protein [Vibrio]|uniref:Sulfurtransferase TusA family protein n=1 Tax=Vibrio ostreae TaxID=2841925 RepID=A0A975UBL2_9VIBR|nr:MULTISPECIES: sulfurtransferase TusA family protein [Vibrio]QXO18066.1 sulfurtransferase TusA family protein [Vibrio ostreae]WGY47609.1 sulfurtransferase TusA family protein [Vibrio sp. ABG19]
MEPNILDLRQQRCPMALLLAKRHTVQLDAGESTTILLSDPNSKRDIEAYLLRQPFTCQSDYADGYFSLYIVKERGSNV